MAWYYRTASGKLAAVFAVRDKGAAWPKNLPFDAEAAGKPLTDSVWPETNSTRVRTITSGKESISLSIYGHTQPVNEGVNFYADDTSAYQVFYGATATKLAEECDPERNAQPPRFSKAGIIDAQKVTLPTGYWLAVRQLVPSSNPKDPKIRRFEILYTKQGDTPFTVWLVGWDSDSYRSEMRTSIMSAKGTNGAPLMEKYGYDGIPSTYFVPFCGVRANLKFTAPGNVIALGQRGFLLAGWSLEDDSVLTFGHDWDRPGIVGYDENIWRLSGYEPYNKSNRRDVKFQTALGEATATEREWDKDHIRYTAGTIEIQPGSYILYRRVWKSSDAPLLKFLKGLGK